MLSRVLFRDIQTATAKYGVACAWAHGVRGHSPLWGAGGGVAKPTTRHPDCWWFGSRPTITSRLLVVRLPPHNNIQTRRRGENPHNT